MVYARQLFAVVVHLDDSVLAGDRISDAATYIKDYPGLQWPHGAPAATALARVETPALRPRMVVPVLRFQLGIIGFDQLAKPAAYYVVITDNIDGRIRLVLGNQADDVSIQYPQCLLVTKDQTPPHHLHGYGRAYDPHGAYH